ncbi:glutathione S-transferase family protein [Ferrovibrio sp.]|uniref:glutathione S-transferase family protein n=1 Tax=Ferrovibrio sp. TaxID=1917215 RepID=UPI003D0B40E9
MLTVHHLGKSQSERIVWLCEELGIPYDLKVYQRAPRLAPPEYKALHPIGSAPVITDGDITLAESGAVMDYILAKYGEGRLALGKDHPSFPDYLYWLHFANGSLQPGFMRLMVTTLLNAPADNQTRQWGDKRLAQMLDLMDQRLSANPWLAGVDFTAADIMTVFSLTTMRHFQPYDLTPYPNIRAYLQRVAARPGYQRAMAKGDAGMELLLG